MHPSRHRRQHRVGQGWYSNTQKYQRRSSAKHCSKPHSRSASSQKTRKGILRRAIHLLELQSRHHRQCRMKSRLRTTVLSERPRGIGCPRLLGKVGSRSQHVPRPIHGSKTYNKQCQSSQLKLRLVVSAFRHDHPHSASSRLIVSFIIFWDKKRVPTGTLFSR